MKKSWMIFLFLISFVFLSSFVYSSNTGQLVVTENNPLYRVLGYNNLNIGNIFTLLDGRIAKVTGLEDVDNFNNLNFFANGILVHNKGIKTKEIKLYRLTPDAISNIPEAVDRGYVPIRTQYATSLPTKESLKDIESAISLTRKDTKGLKWIAYEDGDDTVVIFFKAPPENAACRLNNPHHFDVLINELEQRGLVSISKEDFIPSTGLVLEEDVWNLWYKTIDQRKNSIGRKIAGGQIQHNIITDEITYDFNSGISSYVNERRLKTDQLFYERVNQKIKDSFSPNIPPEKVRHIIKAGGLENKLVEKVVN